MLIVSRKSAARACSGNDHLFFRFSPRSIISSASGVRHWWRTLFSPDASTFSFLNCKTFPVSELEAAAHRESITTNAMLIVGRLIIHASVNNTYSPIENEYLSVFDNAEELLLGMYEKSMLVLGSGFSPAPRVRLLTLPSWS